MPMETNEIFSDRIEEQPLVSASSACFDFEVGVTIQE